MLVSLILKETSLFIHLPTSLLFLIQTSQRNCLHTPLDPPPFHSLTHHNPTFNLISLSFHLSCPGQDLQVLIASLSKHSSLLASVAAAFVASLPLYVYRFCLLCKRFFLGPTCQCPLGLLVWSPLLSTPQPLSQGDLSNPTAVSSIAYRCLKLPLQSESHL